jgi:hypothetical protein
MHSNLPERSNDFNRFCHLSEDLICARLHLVDEIQINLYMYNLRLTLPYGHAIILATLSILLLLFSNYNPL